MIDPTRIAQNCVMQALRRSARVLTQRYEEALKPENLTASQFSVLAAISIQPGVKVTTLAERVGMDRTTLNRVLNPLQRRGLVRLDLSEEDARAKAVYLEPKGNASFARAVPLWEIAQEKTLERIDQKAWSEMQQNLKAIREE